MTPPGASCVEKAVPVPVTVTLPLLTATVPRIPVVPLRKLAAVAVPLESVPVAGAMADPPEAVTGLSVVFLAKALPEVPS